MSSEAQVSKKICMIGDFAVGKTSLVSRFVKNVYSEKYLTTVGVKIDTKEISINDEVIKLVIWDLAGEDRFNSVRLNYLRGAAGYILVSDGTRPDTLETALRLKEDIQNMHGELPFVGLINKVDEAMLWSVPDSSFEGLLARGWDFFKTSAKTGENVQKAFECLCQAMIKKS